MRIALVEDDPAQTELIAGWLVDAGHECRHFGTGGDFLRSTQGEGFDLAILDWGLPDITGIDVLDSLRLGRRESMAVLFVTVRDREEDVVQALTSGADDYLSKPVSRGEMLARIEALGRRTRAAPVTAILDVPPYQLDPDGGTVTRDGVPVTLTEKEFQLASFLFRNQGQLVSRGQILEQVWGTHRDLNTRTVDTHVSKLRAKLGLAPETGWRLRSVYQHGYRLERVLINDTIPRRVAGLVSPSTRPVMTLHSSPGAAANTRCATARLRWIPRWMPGVIMVLWMGLHASAVPAHDWLYSARPGDNIWNLTETHLKSIRYWKQLQRYNALENPDQIRPGTRLRIPIRWLKVQPASARVIDVHGTVQRLVGEAGTGGTAAAGDELRSGDGLRTETASSATLEFADRSRLLVQADTELIMDAMSSYGTTGMVDTTMRLNRGRVENDVTPAVGGGSRYQIITPSAVVAVRGTRFRSAFDDATGIAFGEVTKGGVAVEGAGAGTRIPAGFGTRVARGAPPEAPRPLLPAPALGSGASPETRLLVAIRWPAVEGAAAYRVQLFAQGDPAPLLFDTRVGHPMLELDAPPDGRYRLRVRAIDTLGLEGLDGERPLHVDARPVPPTLLGPAVDARMHGQAPVLWWSHPQGSERFHLQLARDAAFSDLMVDRPAQDGVRHELPAEPEPGLYHWRVAGISAQGEHGPFSDARRFTVQAVPAAAVATSAVSGNEAVITWARAVNAQRYEFELAGDEAFADRLVGETTSQTEVALPELDAGTYYYRIRGVSAEGVTGPYGTVNRLEIPGEPLSPAWLLLLAPLLLLL